MAKVKAAAERVVRTAPAILDWLDGITDRVDIDQEDEESDGEQKAAA